MNHQLWTRVGARVIAVSFVTAGLAACDRQDEARAPAAPAQSAVVIGTAPAQATGDPAGTTPVIGTEVAKSVEQNSMPLPGQPNDHSNLAATPSQNAETSEVLKSTEVAKTANSGPPAERTQ